MIRTDSGYVRNLNLLIVAIVFVVLLIAIWQIRGILMLAFAGILLAIAFSIPVRFFMKMHIGRMPSIILSMASGVALFVLLSYLLLPILFDQFSTLFTTTIPAGTERLIEMWNSGEMYQRVPILEQAIEFLDPINFEINADLINQVISQLSSAVNSVGGSVIPIIGGVASAMISLFIIIFVCFFLIAEPSKYAHGVVRLTPLWYRDRMRDIIEHMDLTMRAWIRVTVISMLLNGTITSIGLALLGVQQWLALGVIAGLLSFIPNFSVFITLIPTVAVTIVQVPDGVLIAILIVVFASFIQANIVGPILASETMHLPPVIVLIGQIIFGFFFGFLGIMLAVPLSAVVAILIEEIYVKDVLGDNTQERESKSYYDDEDDLVYAEAD